MSRWLTCAAFTYAVLCGSVILLAATGVVSGIWTVVVTVPWSFWLLPLAGSPTTADVAVIGCGLLNVAVLAGAGFLLARRAPA